MQTDFSSLSIPCTIQSPCGCGFCGALQTKNIVFCSVESEELARCITMLAPPLASVLLITDSYTYQASRRCFDKRLGRLSYRVKTHIYPTLPCDTLRQANAVSLPEDCKLIIGLGGQTIANLVKYIAAKNQLPAAFILTSPMASSILTPSSVLLADGLPQTYQTASFKTVVADVSFLMQTDRDTLAVAFADLVSHAVSLFDYQCAKLLNGEKFCGHVYQQGCDTIDHALQLVGNDTLQRTQYALIFSMLGQRVGSSRLQGGAEVQAAHTAKMLFTYEERPLRTMGEIQFLFAQKIVALYRNFLSKGESFFVSPPDNNMRAERIEEFLGLDCKTATKKIRPIVSSKTAQLQAYRFREYRDELLEHLLLCEMRLKSAWKTLKRLYTDDGFGMAHYLDTADAALCLALAPDVNDKFTLLGYMKDIGVMMDNYLQELV